MAFWSGFRRLGRNRHYHRGIMHYNRGEYAEAVAAFEEALADRPDRQDPEYSLGAFYAAEARANLGLARFQKGEDARAEEDFRRAFSKGELPEEIETREASAAADGTAARALVAVGLASSMREARRKIAEGALKTYGPGGAAREVRDPEERLADSDSAVLRLGRKFVRVVWRKSPS